MMMFLRTSIAAFLLLGRAQGVTRKNILLIVVDDLRPQFGAYGHNETHAPHLTALANKGMIFDHAYTNYPYCNPSRNSFMSGRMPSKTKVWNFLDHFREVGVGDTWVTLPEHFKNNGYWTGGSGKLFHPQLPPNEDNPRSWSINFSDPGGNEGCNCESAPGGDANKESCELPDDVSPENCTDIMITNTVLAQIAAAAHRQQPFFIGLGIHKPHLPWGLPRRFWELYPDETTLPIAKHPDVPVNMPPIAYHWCDWAHFPHNATRGHPVSTAVAQHARHGYYAAVSFTDSLVAQALTALDQTHNADNTVVVLTADHGWQLGEHCEYCKQTLFETALNIPLIVYDPTRPDTHGKRTNAFAELIDLYRTLSDLAGLDASSIADDVDGASLVPALAGHVGKTAAFSQMGRCFNWKNNVDAPWTPWTGADACPFVNRSRIMYMGYSIRTNDWRYTEWVAWDGAKLGPLWNAVNATELYDHRGCTEEPGCNADFDRWENENVAGTQPAVEASLRQQLRAHYAV
eukprot:m.386481 g.386481  ORF g.386481 m.386481 type:complete len:516 (-) comp21014_c2_seq15:267-1814(-)